MRLDTWVRHQWPWVPYGSIQKAIRRGWVRLDEQKVTPDTRLWGHTAVFFNDKWLSSFQTPDPARPLSDTWHMRVKRWVIYEDDHLIAFNKPQGIACQGGSGQQVHMDDLLKSWDPHKKIRLVHRLDIDTSGVFVMAKTLACAQRISRSFHDQRIQKTYWAIVHGHPPHKGRIAHALERKGQKMVTSQGPQALSAFTEYRVHQKGYELHTQSPFAWVELFPKTGRTHQLRVHLEHLGHPIVGDALYGSPLKGPMALHCHHMNFSYFGKQYDLRAPLPSLFLERLEKSGLSSDARLLTLSRSK